MDQREPLFGSADQRQWQRMARRLRSELLARMNDIGCMTFDEIQQLINSLDNAMNFMCSANNFDAQVTYIEKQFNRPIF